MSVASFSFDLAPKAAMEYLAAKGQKLSFNYDEMMYEAHHKTFTVAKVTKLDLLADIYESLNRAMAEGIPFEQWKKELKPTLQKYGWWGETTVTNPDTGEVRDIYVGSRRLRTIYYTNMRVSQSVGRYKEMMELPLSVYWKYHAIKDGKSRPSHLALDGMVRHRDDPIWKRIFPPNAWNCRCFVTAHTKAQCERNGWKISSPDEPLPDGFEPHSDWDYDVGAGAAYSAEQAYFQKIQAMQCKEPNAKVRDVLCPFAEAARKGYAADMQKLLPTKKEWDDFVDRALDTSIKKHEELRLGYLSMIVGLEEFLAANPPQSDLILADTGSVRNLRAKSEGSKKGKVLESDEIKELISKINEPDEILFDGDILLVWNFKGGKNKIVLELDYEQKHRVFNTLKSSQKYTDKQYLDFIRGKEQIK